MWPGSYLGSYFHMTCTRDESHANKNARRLASICKFEPLAD
jgi:hypothetical protein